MLFDHLKKRFSEPETQLFSAILQLWSSESLWPLKLSSSPCIRQRHTSFSRQIHNILCWLEILNYCPDGGNGNFHCSSSFLKSTSLICEAQLSFAAHQKYIIWFFSLWWMIKGVWEDLFSLFIFLWNRKPWLDNFMFIIPLECSKLWIWMGIYFRDILLVRISKSANNCVQCIWEKHLFHEIFPHFKFLLSNERLDFCDFF